MNPGIYRDGEPKVLSGPRDMRLLSRGEMGCAVWNAGGRGVGSYLKVHYLSGHFPFYNMALSWPTRRRKTDAVGKAGFGFWSRTGTG